MHSRISSDSCSCSSYYCQEVKTTRVFTHIHKYFSHNSLSNTTSFALLGITGTKFLSAVVKIPWHYHHPRISSRRKWLRLPIPLLFSITFQAWKMVLQNSMTFHDEWAPCSPARCPLCDSPARCPLCESSTVPVMWQSSMVPVMW